MTRYLVTWELDAECDTPIEAARQARDEQRNPLSVAPVFTVLDLETGATTTIDLEDTP